MDPFLFSVAASLAGGLIVEAARTPGKQLASLLHGDLERKALQEVFREALAYMLEKVAGHLELNTQKHIQGLLEDFLKRDGVAAKLVQVAVDLDDVPAEDLEKTFNEVGFESGTIPISFQTLMETTLDGLSIALDKELHKAHSPLHERVAQDRAKKVLEISKSLSQSVAGLFEGQESLLRNDELMIRKLDEIQISQESGAGECWARFKLARESLNQFKITEAKIVLDELRELPGSECPVDLKPKVLGLLSRIEELKGDFDSAIQLRGLAADSAKERREKLIQLAHLYRLTGENDEMFKTAEELVQDAPHTADGWTFWIQSAPVGLSLDEIESRVSGIIRNDADVLFALSVRAADASLWEIAEVYARKGFSLAPDSPPASLNLAICLLRKLEGHLPGSVPADRVRTVLEEAESLLRNGISLAGENPPKEIMVLLRANLALVLRMLGRSGEALQEQAALYALKRDKAQVTLEYARLLANENRTQDAKRVLSEHLEVHTSDMGSALLMELYLDEKPPDYLGALDVADNALNHPIDDSMSRLILLHNCISAAKGLGDRERAQSYLSKSTELEAVASSALTAEFERQWGDAHKAQELLHEALEALDASSSPDLKRYLARVLESVGLHRDALDVWRRLVSTEFLSSDTYAFLRCAKTCESFSDILVTCRELRANGILTLLLYDIELSVLHQVNSLNDAIKLTQRYLDQPLREDEKRYIRYQLSTLGVLTGNNALCEGDTSKLPSVEEVSPDIGENMVNLLFKNRLYDDALRYAYELTRRFPDAVQSHRSVVAALFHNAPLDVYDRNSAELGTAIEYETTVGQEKDWIILEDSRDPKTSRQEFGPDEPLHQELLGKAVGDQFVLRRGQIQNLEARVVQILSKFVYRLHKSMITLARLFGPEGGIEMVSLRGESSEDLDLQPIFQDLDRYEHEVTEILSEYKSKPIPLVILARMLGKNVLQTLPSMHTELGLYIYCSTGLEKETNGSLRQLRTANALVLDLSAIGTLLVCDALNLLFDEAVPICLTEGVTRHLREALEYSKHLLRSEGNLGKVRGEYAFLPADREAMEQWCKRLEDAIHYFESKAEVVGGSVALEISQSAQAKLSQILPHYVIETIALAQRQGHVLWCDDGRLVAVVSSVCGEQPRIWTQLIARDRAESGQYARESETKLSAAMLNRGYLHMTLDRDIIRHLMGDGNYEPTHHAVRVLLNQLDGMKANPGVALRYAGMLLKTLWQDALSDIQKTSLGDSILKELRAQPQGGLIIRVLRDSLDTVFGVDVLNGKRCRDFMDAWLASAFL